MKVEGLIDDANANQANVSHLLVLSLHLYHTEIHESKVNVPKGERKSTKKVTLVR